MNEVSAGFRAEPSAPDLRAALERALDSATPFGAADLKAIGEWPVRDRVVLLCLAGLWRKVRRRLADEFIALMRERVPFDQQVVDYQVQAGIR